MAIPMAASVHSVCRRLPSVLAQSSSEVRESSVMFNVLSPSRTLWQVWEEFASNMTKKKRNHSGLINSDA